MLVEQLIQDLQNLTKQRITQKDLGDALGISKQAIGNKKADNYEFAEYEINKIKDYVISKYSDNKCTLVDNSDSVTIDYYPDVLVSCGNGIFSLGETKEKMTVPKHFIKGYSDAQKYIIVTAFSDSMQPKIEEKDLLIVRLTNFEEIMDNHIYVFCHDGRFYCKYLSYNVGQIIVKSENPDYPTRYIEKENLCNFELIGEIVGLMRDFR